MLVSAATRSLITMSADVAVTKVDQDGIIEYDKGNKTYAYDGFGVVGTWGQRDGINNQFDRYVRGEIEGTNASVTVLKDIVWKFLQERFNPRERDPLPNNVGFHVGGYDISGKAHLYHIYWTLGGDGRDGHCTLEDQSPFDDIAARFLYNGLPEVANTLLYSLILLVSRGSEVNFNFSNSMDIVRFSDLLCRIAAELTPEVSPPFHIYFVAPGNQIERLINPAFAPVDTEKVSLLLRLLKIT